MSCSRSNLETDEVLESNYPCSISSRRSKSGRPDFGVFETCPVLKRPVFRRRSEIRTISSGYRTSGSFQSQPPAIGRPVPIVFNRTSDSRNRLKTGYNVRISDVRLETIETSEIRTLYPVIGRLYSIGRPITGQYCPVIGRLYKSEIRR